MSRARGALSILAVILAAGSGGYWLGHPEPGTSELMTSAGVAQTNARTPSGPVLYYQHPDGKPLYSAEPKQTPDGRPYRAVLSGEKIGFDSKSAKPATPGQPGSKRIFYYRNPMGLPDTSPVPKKDWMGMDYIPVYEGEEQDDGKTVKVSLDKVQRSGVRTEAVETRVIVRPVRAVGTVMHDKSRLTDRHHAIGRISSKICSSAGPASMSMPASRCSASTARIFNVRRSIFSSPWARPARKRCSCVRASRNVEGALQRLRNLAVPESRIREVRETGANPRTLDWPAPATGDVIEKKVINGQRVQAGEELYRIADHAHLWVIADVAESDLSAIKIGTRATVTVRAYAAQPIEGEVTFIYPELRAETRTARVRIEVPNPDGRLKMDMYADVVFQAGAKRAARDRRSGQRRHRQRHAAGRAGRQGRRPLRAAPGQARPPRRRLCRGARRRRPRAKRSSRPRPS